jgi:hypothetical protein
LVSDGNPYISKYYNLRKKVYVPPPTSSPTSHLTNAMEKRREREREREKKKEKPLNAQETA